MSIQNCYGKGRLIYKKLNSVADDIELRIKGNS